MARDLCDAFDVAEMRRAEQQVVDDTEDRRGRAHADGNRQNRDGRKRRRLAQRSNGVADILKERVHSRWFIPVSS